MTASTLVQQLSDPSVVRLAADAGAQGPGTLLRVVIVVSVLGAVLGAWFLLRGYADDAPSGQGPAGGPAGGREADGRAAGGAAEGAAARVAGPRRGGDGTPE
ncbi:hypothetical protein [Allostreptomyces psammosilenae]|uniref:Uncharacterized protein n=1 Tax=Allostreptomyces psammosilenae TaxID=1892865 RepID=A0A853A142_9ACTN|nr:hypothetical protein [Allostreptomyces psammosilenae]NYI06644.1 hypothetical protein [Allostreptomyces psammosilenae]